MTAPMQPLDIPLTGNGWDNGVPVTLTYSQKPRKKYPPFSKTHF